MTFTTAAYEISAARELSRYHGKATTINFNMRVSMACLFLEIENIFLNQRQNTVRLEEIK